MSKIFSWCARQALAERKPENSLPFCVPACVQCLRWPVGLHRYGRDFGTKKDLLIFLLRHLPEPASRALEAMLEECLGDVSSIKFTFRPYDWSQNSK